MEHKEDNIYNGKYCERDLDDYYIYMKSKGSKRKFVSENSLSYWETPLKIMESFGLSPSIFIRIGFENNKIPGGPFVSSYTGDHIKKLCIEYIEGIKEDVYMTADSLNRFYNSCIKEGLDSELFERFMPSWFLYLKNPVEYEDLKKECIDDLKTIVPIKECIYDIFGKNNIERILNNVN